MSDPAYRPGIDAARHDLSGPPHPGLARLREIATCIDRRAEAVGRKIAVVTTTPVTYGVARQFQALTDMGPR